MGLADVRQISEKAVFTSPAFQPVLPLMDGNKSVDEIVGAVGNGLTRTPLEYLIGQLDDAGLLFGPTYEGLVTKLHADFDGSEVLPPATTAAFADALAELTVRMERPEVVREKPVELTDAEREQIGVRRLREVFNGWIDESLKQDANPSLDMLPKGIVVPHLDYQRGWMNYASVWGRLRVVDRPDRVIILGTNHFGEGTGVVGCNKGYQSPLGTCEADAKFIETLSANLGPEKAKKLFANRYDHEREHSIELQIPWIQHVLGKDESGNFPTVFGALVHDPSVNNGESYDGEGLSLSDFVTALRATIGSMPGKTLLVASADLSHVGLAFGDKCGVAQVDPAREGGEEHNKQAETFRNQTFQHDRDMLQLVAEGKIDQLIASMAWQQNPTRWCSIGNLSALFNTLEPKTVRVYNYAAAVDEQTQSMVSSVGMSLD